MSLDDARANIGGRVAYIPRGGGAVELGVITVASDRFVFVRFDGYRIGKACDPADLRVVAS